MSALEDWFNRLNDWDLTWYGFGKLKPKIHELMPMRTVLILTGFYAPIAATITILSTLMLAEMYAFQVRVIVLVAIGIFAALAFLILQSMSAMFWNRRARRMK